MLAGGWGCLLGLGVKAAVGSEPAPSSPPAHTVAHTDEYQAPHTDGVVYLCVTLGSAAVGAAVGAAKDLLAARPLQDGSSAGTHSDV